MKNEYLHKSLKELIEHFNKCEVNVRLGKEYFTQWNKLLVIYLHTKNINVEILTIDTGKTTSDKKVDEMMNYIKEKHSLLNIDILNLEEKCKKVLVD